MGLLPVLSISHMFGLLLLLCVFVCLSRLIFYLCDDLKKKKFSFIKKRVKEYFLCNGVGGGEAVFVGVFCTPKCVLSLMYAPPHRSEKEKSL